MRDVLRQMRPDRFEDLIAAVALYRPGPMANIPDYCRRKHGETWQAPHPELAEILGETYGIMVYQEQVMQIAQKMGGYSLGSADLLRRAMGKKIRSEMEAQRETFVAGATARGIPRGEGHRGLRTHGEVRRLRLQQIARRGLRAGRLSDGVDEGEPPRGVHRGLHEPGARQHRPACRAARGGGAFGIRILPPDINRSGADFTVERLPEGGLAIRYALAAVKKVGFAAMQALVEARGDQPFTDLADLRRARRSAAAQPHADGESDPRRRLRYAGAEPCAAVRRRRGDPAPRPGDGGGEGERPDRSVRRVVRQLRRRCACPMCRTGRRWTD